jgi:hypothetical protein
MHNERTLKRRIVLLALGLTLLGCLSGTASLMVGVLLLVLAGVCFLIAFTR